VISLLCFKTQILFSSDLINFKGLKFCQCGPFENSLKIKKGESSLSFSLSLFFKAKKREEREREGNPFFDLNFHKGLTRLSNLGRWNRMMT